MPDRRRRASVYRQRARRRIEEVARRLGAMLREARRARGLRQADVAERAGVTQSWISRMERGHGGTASLETWAAAAAAASVQLVTFLETIPGADRPRDYEHLKRQRLIVDLARQGGWTAIPEATLDRDRSRLFPRSVDVGLRRPATGERAIVEIWDYFDDVGAAIRSFERKIADAESAGPEQVGAVGGLFVVRGTRRNRQLVSEFQSLFAARFPGSSAAWLRALTEPEAPMPAQPAFIWTDVPGTRLIAARLRLDPVVGRMIRDTHR
jgi:transcriptional regulator with XRE-family HTH domain